MGELRERLLVLLPLILSLSVHEWAHAWSAYRLGDDTAARMGRLTLNPLAHIDFVGTILLPLLGIPFGWAKPVPVNPARFNRSVTMRTGMMITAAAGPLSNVIIAIASAIALGLIVRFGGAHGTHRADAIGVVELLGKTIQMNIALAIFNLLPFPPLDGSRVVEGLLPERFRPQYEAIARFGSIGLLLVIVVGARFLAVPISAATSAVGRLITLVAGGA